MKKSCFLDHIISINLEHNTMKNLSVLLLFAILLFSTSCNKSTDSTSSEFSNSLKLGTGFSTTFDLAGEGTTFQHGTNIYFRLESKDDMAGSPVRINVKGSGVDVNFDFQNPQSYGHILISAFSVTNSGSYTATGILTTGNKTVASINFTVK